LAAQDGQLACERIINVLEEIMEGRSELPKPAFPSVWRLVQGKRTSPD